MVAGSLISSGNPPAFELQQDGTLYARRANISGSIYADSGRLNNVIIDKNCHINGTLSATQIEGDIVKMYPCPKNGLITIHPAPFDREFHIQPVTLSAVAYYGVGNSLEVIRWDLGLLEIFIRNERGNFSRRYTVETSRQNLTVTKCYHGDIPAGERFYISTSTPRINFTHGIPDFITIMVVKK